MNAIIKEILALPGVAGTCVVNGDQAVLVAELPKSFTASMAGEVAGNTGRMMQMAGVKGLAPKTVSIHYDTFTILALTLSESAMLLILCKPGCNTSLVTTTSHMLAPELTKTLQQQEAQPEPSHETPQTNAGSTQIDAKTTQALEFLKQSLFETVGPIAEMIYEDCLERWTANSPADISRIFELVGCLSTEMDNPDLFQEFKSKIASLL